jgi:cytidine deaminase
MVSVDLSTTDLAAMVEIVRAEALRATRNAYAPYSSWQVGAAGITRDGTVFSGCNVENSSFGMTLCAETSMIGTAVTAGDHDFLVVCCRLSTGDYLPPCGRCRQMLLEIAGLDCRVVVDDRTEQPPSVSDLLPYPYIGDDLRLRDKEWG